MARWLWTRAELLRNPASHHGVVFRCRAQNSAVCGFANCNRPLPFRENSGPSIIQITPKKDYCSAVQSVPWKGLCISQGARPGSILCCRWDDKKNVPQTFIVRSPRKSTKRDILEMNIPRTTIWKILKKRLRCQPCSLQLVQALRDGDKDNDMRFVVKCLTKWKTKMITWIQFC